LQETVEDSSMKCKYTRDNR